MAEAVDGKKVIREFAERNGSHPKIRFIKDDLEGIIIEPLTGSGDVNYVFRVSSRDRKQNVIIKHGQPVSRTMDMHIPMERQDLEYRAIEEIHAFLPGSVPQPYCFDRQLHTMAMEDLSHMRVLDSDLMEADCDEILKKIGQLVSKIHHQTSKKVVSEEKWQELLSKFKFGETLKWYTETLFVHLFIADHPVYMMRDGCLETFNQCVNSIRAAGLEATLMETMKREDCLIHGDLHRQSLFVSEDRIAMFDFEFATLANSGYDVCWLLCGLVFRTYELISKQPEKSTEITDMVKTSIKTYLESYMEGRLDIDTAALRKNFMSDISLFLGMMMFFLSRYRGVLSFDLTDEMRNYMMQGGTKLMLDRESFTSWDEFIDVVMWNQPTTK